VARERSCDLEESNHTLGNCKGVDRGQEAGQGLQPVLRSDFIRHGGASSTIRRIREMPPTWPKGNSAPPCTPPLTRLRPPTGPHALAPRVPVQLSRAAMPMRPTRPVPEAERHLRSTSCAAVEGSIALVQG
jgi:hypothetical protein